MRLYEQMFAVANPGEAPEGGTFLDNVNSDSLRCVRGWMEPALADACVGDRVQFERLGYFCKDRESTAEMPVFNRTVTLRDSWAKLEKRSG